MQPTAFACKERPLLLWKNVSHIEKLASMTKRSHSHLMHLGSFFFLPHSTSKYFLRGAEQRKMLLWDVMTIISNGNHFFMLTLNAGWRIFLAHNFYTLHNVVIGLCFWMKFSHNWRAQVQLLNILIHITLMHCAF